MNECLWMWSVHGTKIIWPFLRCLLIRPSISFAFCSIVIIVRLKRHNCCDAFIWALFLWYSVLRMNLPIVFRCWAGWCGLKQNQKSDSLMIVQRITMNLNWFALLLLLLLLSSSSYPKKKISPTFQSIVSFQSNIVLSFLCFFRFKLLVNLMLTICMQIHVWFHSLSKRQWKNDDALLERRTHLLKSTI